MSERGERPSCINMPLYAVIRPRRGSLPMLATAALGAALATAPPRVAAAEERDLRYDAFATVSPLAAFVMGDLEYGLNADLIVEVGLGGSVSRRFGEHFDLGIGLRYDYGRAGPGAGFMHNVAAPLAATLVLPFGASELRLGVGLGPAFGWVGYSSKSGTAAHVLGASSELAISYARRLGASGLGLCVQLGIRLDLMPELDANPEGDLDGSALFHLQIPFVRAGASWR